MMKTLQSHRIAPAVVLACGLLAAMASNPARAEPYLAVESGLRCSNCHVNPAGGGKRNEFGLTYARTQIAATRILSEDAEGAWNGTVTDWFGVGGDYRGGYMDIDIPGVASASETTVTKSTLYAEFRAIPDKLTFYFDEQLSPGNSETREAFALIRPGNGRYSIKAGQFFLPFGLRLQDDSAFVRQRSGINFDTPADDGVELGVNLTKWSVRASLTETDVGLQSDREQLNASATYYFSRWRLGGSYSQVDDPLGDRDMLGLFAGWRTGPIAWLAEIDLIDDKSPLGPGNETYATLVEGNYRLKRSHNIKLTYEFLDPSDRVSEDEQERYSLLWEYSPIQLLQTRIGIRRYNGIPPLPFTNRDEIFAEVHVYF
jgi:hypothetical protein